MSRNSNFNLNFLFIPKLKYIKKWLLINTFRLKNMTLKIVIQYCMYFFLVKSQIIAFLYCHE
jgi:hypothetical protein